MINAHRRARMLAVILGEYVSMTGTTTYDIVQTSFVFSFLANSASNTTGTPAALAAQLNGNITNYISSAGTSLAGVSDWEIAWGPGIYQASGDQMADNAAVVVFSPTLNVYVLAIAGTNPEDPYDWIIEDLEVGPKLMVNFPVALTAKPTPIDADTSVAQVSLGTALGIYYVMTSTVGASTNTNFTQLQAYLSTLEPKAGATLIVAGHSLGGALSATLGLELVTSIGTNLSSNWAASNILTLSTAAPSPGNGAFSTLWASKLPVTSAANVVPNLPLNPGNQITSFNAPVWDTYDVVPHAWQNIYALTDNNAFYFYGPTIKTLQSQATELQESAAPGWVNGLEVALATAQLAGTGGGMNALPNRVSFTATFPVEIRTNGVFSQYTPPNPVTSLDDLKTALGMIHVWQYFQAFGFQPQDANL